MKKKILLSLFALVLSFLVVFSLASCDEVYTSEETDVMIAELNEAIEKSKSELDAKINALTAEYTAKNDAILAEIASDKAELAELKAKYDADLAKLNKADSDNKSSLDLLTASYEAKIAELEAADKLTDEALAALRGEYETELAELKKADGENKAAIESLTTTYEAKVKELEAADKLTDEALAALRGEYETELAELKKADGENKAAIESLTTTYEAKVKSIDAKIEAANSKIDANKAELDATITELGNSYTTKINELENLIKEIQAADDKQDETIKGLEEYFNSKIAEIENKHEDEIKTLLDKIAELEKVETYTVIFNSNCGTKVESQTVVAGTMAIEPEALVKEGYAFLGWYLGDTKWEFVGYPVTKNITLSAKWNQTGTNGIKYSLGIDNEIVLTVIGYDGVEKDVVIPSSVNGYPVTKIAESAFESCTSITSIIIPDSVTSIGSYAFENCTSLASITIPDSVTSIGSSAFSGCTSLASITIPNSVTSIGSYAFYDCTSLASITIPNSVTSIGSYVFENCTSLTIYCEASSKPDGWDSSWNYSDCPIVWGVKDCGITEDGFLWIDIDGGIIITGYEGTSNEITIPEKIDGKNVVSISNKAFYDKSTLTTIMIPNSVTSIGSFAFSGCTKLTIYCEASSKPDGWSSSWNSSNCPVVWGVKDYGITEDGFKWMDRDGGIIITEYEGTSSEITIPKKIDGKNVVSIYGKAFYNKSTLTTITIPNSVTSIGNSAFRGCTNLTIYCEASSKPDGWNSLWNSSNCPVVWGYTGLNGITSDGLKWASVDGGIIITGYEGTSSEITIPEKIDGKNVVSIFNKAFHYKSTLTTIIIPNSVKSIGNYAFYGCTSLTSITIPNNVTSIGEYAFYGCTGLTSITIPDSVTSIGNSAFSGCTNLTIYCEASSKPDGWNSLWNYSNCPVVWGCKS